MPRKQNLPCVDEDLNWKYSLDDLDLFKDLTHLVNMVLRKVKENVPESQPYCFVLQGETHDYRELAREGRFSIPEDSPFITYLAIKNSILPRSDQTLGKFFEEEEVLAFLLQNDMHMDVFVPVVYRFRLLGFLGLDLSGRKKFSLSTEENAFLDSLKTALRTTLYAALLVDKRLYEILALNEVTKRLTFYEIYDDVADNIAHIVESLVSFDCAVYYEYQEFEKKLYPRSSKNIENLIPMDEGSGVSGFVLEKKKPLLIQNINEHTFFGSREHEDYLKLSVISLPLLSSQKCYGVLTLGRNKKNQEFSVDNLYLLKIVSSFLVDVMENKMLYQKLETSYLETITALASALEAKDSYTKGHSERVMTYSVGIAEELELSPYKIREIRFAAILHDIGKIGIHEHIITKPGRLSPEEYQDIQHHPEIGAGILSQVQFLSKATEYVKYHHEKLDGTGYYRKKMGEYPWESTIINLADSFDAMTSNRSYRKASLPELAIMELKKSVGRQYDTRVFEAFVRYLKKSGIIRMNLPV